MLQGIWHDNCNYYVRGRISCLQDFGYYNENQRFTMNFAKTIVLFVIAMSAGLLGCVDHDLLTDSSQIFGSGRMVTEVRERPSFTGVAFNTAGDVYITQGEEQSITVTTDDNLQEYIDTKVSDGILHIQVRTGISISNLTLNVELVMPDIESLIVNSAGSIRTRGTINTDELVIDINSAGNIEADVNAGTIFSLLASAGSMFLDGTATLHKSILASAGSLKAFGLSTHTTDILVSSAGHAEVYATELLIAQLTSAGHLYYKGNPQLSITETSTGRAHDSN